MIEGIAGHALFSGRQASRPKPELDAASELRLSRVAAPLAVGAKCFADKDNRDESRSARLRERVQKKAFQGGLRRSCGARPPASREEGKFIFPVKLTNWRVLPKEAKASLGMELIYLQNKSVVSDETYFYPAGIRLCSVPFEGGGGGMSPLKEPG